MKITRLDQRLRKKVNSILTIVPIVVCAFAIVSTSTAQSVSAVTASSPAIPGDDKPGDPVKVKFKAPTIPTPKAGVASAFNLCNGQLVRLPEGFTDADGLKMDTNLKPCGEQSSSTSQVSGGNPPYHFQWATGEFPPLGMHIGMNGLLYGTPAPPPLGGYKQFKVCAVDVSANPNCQEVKWPNEPAQQAHSSHAAAWALIGGAVLGGAFAVHEMNNSSSGSGDETGTCSGLSPVNACGPCTCTDDGNSCNDAQCGGGTYGMCAWAGPGSPVGNAPFCANGQPD
ncbi:MAG: hypothetical protein WB538_18735 [Candidatus Sulfotelmatobacter sp.]